MAIKQVYQQYFLTINETYDQHFSAAGAGFFTFEEYKFVLWMNLQEIYKFDGQTLIPIFIYAIQCITIGEHSAG